MKYSYFLLAENITWYTRQLFTITMDHTVGQCGLKFVLFSITRNYGRRIEPLKEYGWMVGFVRRLFYPV